MNWNIMGFIFKLLNCTLISEGYYSSKSVEYEQDRLFFKTHK